MIISTTNIQEAKKIILKTKKENPKELIIVRAQDDEFNRKILETKDVNVLLSPEIHDRKDYMKQRDSGLNEFLTKLAAKNNISIGINIDEIQKLDKKDKARILARIKQNIMLCKKAKCKISIFPKGKFTKQDIMGFMMTLGASTDLAKKASEDNNNNS